jgi:hypothetical protein
MNTTGIEPNVKKKIKYDSDSGCSLWTGYCDKGGYGRLSRTVNGKMVTYWAHRFFYELIKGPIPYGMHLHHRSACISRRCVDPDHLQPVPPPINSKLISRASALLTDHKIINMVEEFSKNNPKPTELCGTFFEKRRLGDLAHIWGWAFLFSFEGIWDESLIDRPGLYAVWDPENLLEIIYIAINARIRKRLSRNPHKNICVLPAWPDEADLLRVYERNAIKEIKPMWNG